MLITSAIVGYCRPLRACSEIDLQHILIGVMDRLTQIPSSEFGNNSTLPYTSDIMVAAKKKLQSQIIRLAKSILLKPTDPPKYPSVQFIAGKHSPFIFPAGIGISWWYSDDTFHALESVATLLIESAAEFADCDIESVIDVVSKTLQEVCLEKTLFDGGAVSFRRKDTLFACCIAPVTEFADSILQEITTNLGNCMGRRCTVYAIPRFKVASFVIPGRSIRLIARDDEEAWQKLVDDGYQFDGWSPLCPQLRLIKDRTVSPPSKFECVLVAEENGTQQGARFNSILKFRKLAALLFAVACERSPHNIHKAMARPFEFCVQFAHKSSVNGGVTRNNCDPVIPYCASDVKLYSEDISSILGWYKQLDRCSDEHRGRIEKSAYFVNRGINSDDIESYINYFVALDALFGQRGSVEASIFEGVQALNLDAHLTEKTRWLFDLRNEIVHGGSRYISEWPKYRQYTQHFRSKPIDDVRDLAQSTMLRAPSLYAQ